MGSIILIETTVPAGFPSPAQDYMENRIDLNEKLIYNPSSTFLVKEVGDSMVGEGYFLAQFSLSKGQHVEQLVVQAGFTSSFEIFL